MDFERQQPSHRPEPTPSVPTTPSASNVDYKKSGGRKKKWWMLLLVLLLIAGAAIAGYWWRGEDAKDEAKKAAAAASVLQQQIDQLEKDLTAAKAEHKETSTEASAKAPSQATLDNIEAAVKSGNYAALQGYMASKVTVILAASEGLGERTPTQAIADVKYLDDGTDPWNFDLSAATMENYMDGDYKKYFPEGALVGKSANNYVVSFTFDHEAKISGIFMTSNAALL